MFDSVCVCACVCRCAHVFVWWHFHRAPGQGLSIINMSRWIPLRCGDMCVYSAVWRAKRDWHMYAGLSLSVDTGSWMSTSLRGHYFQCSNVLSFLHFFFLCNDEERLRYLNLICAHCYLHNKWIDWQESEKPGGLVWGNILLNPLPRKWLEFLVLNMPNE